MSNFVCKRANLAVVLSLGGFLLTSFSSASSQNLNKAAEIGVKAYSTPISNIEITFKVSTPEAGEATVRVQEGGMGKLIAVNLNKGYALIPMLNPLDPNAVDFTVMALTVDGNGNESIRQIGKITGSAGQELAPETAPGLRLNLTTIDRGK